MVAREPTQPHHSRVHSCCFSSFDCFLVVLFNRLAHSASPRLWATNVQGVGVRDEGEAGGGGSRIIHEHSSASKLSSHREIGGVQGWEGNWLCATMVGFAESV